MPHEHIGSHLDSQGRIVEDTKGRLKGRTVDDTLEKSNFKFAGKIWSDVMIDKFPSRHCWKYPIISFQKTVNVATETLLTTDSTWFQEHVRTSQYFTQIVNCDKN